ncbi:hypothetical protein B0H19DRAFT_996156 [Mycena capillaripes]|nr:hypothetical protein B0H19DRAFT_996156 [Mycena capillaripes]
MHHLSSVRTLEMSLRIVFVAMTGDIFRKGFVAAFPAVTCLVLSCDFAWRPAPLIDMICLFPALQELHIRDISRTLADPPANAVPPRGLNSLNLGVQSLSPIFGWLLAFNHLPNVNSVTLPILRGEHASVVRAALQQLGGALHHLDISPRVVEASTVFDLSLHPNLRTLAIRHFTPDPVEALNQIVQFLTRLDAPSLERLSLDLSSFQTSNWGVLDAFLSTAQFLSLRGVSYSNAARMIRSFCARRCLCLAQGVC